MQARQVIAPIAGAPSTVDATTKSSLRASYAAPATRALALAIDVALLGSALWLAQLLHGAITHGPGSLNPRLGLPLAFLATLAYFLFFEASAWRGTPGKRCLGLRVTDLLGHRVTRSRAMMRFVLASLSLLAMGIPWLSAVRDARRQTVHDRASNTIVLRRPEAPPLRGRNLLVATAATLLWWLGSIAYVVLSQTSAGALASDALNQALAAATLKKQAARAVHLAQPLFQYIEESRRQTGGLPTRIPEGLRVHLGSDAKSLVKYDPRSGNIHMHLSAGTRRATILLSPHFPTDTSPIRWACGSYGIPREDLPVVCDRGIE